MGHVKMCRNPYPFDFRVWPYLVGDWIFTEVIELKWGHWGVSLCDWCPHEMSKFRHEERNTHRENAMWRWKLRLSWRFHEPRDAKACQQATGNSAARNRLFLTALRKNQFCWHLDLRILISITERQYISAVFAAQFLFKCHSGPSEAIQRYMRR